MVDDDIWVYFNRRGGLKTFGAPISRSFTLSGTQVIKTGDATYIKTTTGKRTNLVKGEKVVVKFFVVRGRRNQATDVVVLPNDTKFK